VVYWSAAVNREMGTVEDSFHCPSCNAELSKRNLERAWVNYYDEGLKAQHQQIKQVPVAINYSIGGKAI
jgi:hypothetical protein